MQHATLVLDRDFTLAEVDPRLFSGFAEHLGRHIYTGIYEPDHPTADEHGFRQDVIALVRELRMPLIRYPGGNFVSNYRWEDGVGPREQRPRRLDLAWGATEPNTFGTNEFVTWCRLVGAEPMLAVNLGTRGPAEAQALVEYCNHPGGTFYSDLRRSHGYPEPHRVPLWCLGNEMDGPWQMGQKTAAEYGRIAAEAAKMMKATDPTIETVLCGSSSRGMRTFGTWEWEALHAAYDRVDYLSLHTYYGNANNDTPSFLARPDELADFLREGIALCDAVRAARKARRAIQISLDEWNVWRQTPELVESGEQWSEARPQLEQRYTLEDALVVGGMLITLLNFAERVRIACLAQIVNVIAPIMTEPGGRAWRQTIYHPFVTASRLGRGIALRCVVSAPRYDCALREGVPIIHLAAVADDEHLTLFALNRDPTGEPVTLAGTLRGFTGLRRARHFVLTGPDLHATNSADDPDRVAIAALETGPTLEGERFTVVLPPFSWNAVRFGPG